MRTKHIITIALTLSTLGFAVGCGKGEGDVFQIVAPKEGVILPETPRPEITVAQNGDAITSPDNPIPGPTDPTSEDPTEEREDTEIPVAADPLQAPTLLWATPSEDGKWVDVGFRDESTAETAFYVERAYGACSPDSRFAVRFPDMLHSDDTTGTGDTVEHSSPEGPERYEAGAAYCFRVVAMDRMGHRSPSLGLNVQMPEQNIEVVHRRPR